jgi:hypothetical protein
LHSDTSAAPRLESAVFFETEPSLGEALGDVHFEAAERAEARLRVVCTDSPRVVALLPCGHVACCASCVNSAVNDANGGRSCPLCRAAVAGTVAFVL